MIADKINKFTESFEFVQGKTQHSQKDIMQIVHQQFQIPAIKKLYPDPKWTERAFWVVHGNISQIYEDLSVDSIIECIMRYTQDMGLPTIPNNNLNVGDK